MSDNSSILNKIRALLANGKDGANMAASSAYAAKAAELMEEHNISMADVIAEEIRSKDEAIDFVYVGDWGYSTSKTFPKWSMHLCFQVAKLFDCELKFQWSKKHKNSTCLAIYGYVTDIKIADWTFHYLVEEVWRHFNTYWKENERYYKRRGVTFNAARTSFTAGAAEALDTRLRELIKQKKTIQSAGTSLIVLKSVAIVNKFGEFKYGKGTSANIANPEIANAGFKAGKSIRLNENRPLENADPAMALCA